MKLTIKRSRKQIGDEIKVDFTFSREGYVDYSTQFIGTAIDKYLAFKGINTNQVSIIAFKDELLVALPNGETKTFPLPDWREDRAYIIAAHIINISREIEKILKQTHDVLNEEFSVEI